MTEMGSPRACSLIERRAHGRGRQAAMLVTTGLELDEVECGFAATAGMPDGTSAIPSTPSMGLFSDADGQLSISLETGPQHYPKLGKPGKHSEYGKTAVAGRSFQKLRNTFPVSPANRPDAGFLTSIP